MSGLPQGGIHQPSDCECVCRYIPGEDLNTAMKTLMVNLASDPAKWEKSFECSTAIAKHVFIVGLSEPVT